ncbi:MAG: phosphoribosylanthranilate isomerase [Holophaga sp.]
MPAVKVCGLTRVEDAQLAWELGAAALGFVFHPASPRSVTAAQAARIRAELPADAYLVGVFVNRTIAEIEDIADAVGLSVVQLHGQETPEMVSQFTRPVIKAIRAEEADEGRLRSFQVAAFLLDASHPTLPGGTGFQADWLLARDLAKRHPLLLAGGLHPENVCEALEVVSPRGLDLSSGLESTPGLKDPVRLRTLFQRLPNHGERPCLF